MNNGEANTRDQRVVGAYRAASDTLDERPQAATRAAILAAAARAVDAQPQDAATGATSPRSAQRTRARLSAPFLSKGPVALVASFLVATVALVLATHTMQEQPASTPAPAITAHVASVEEKRAQTPEEPAPAEKERGQRRDTDLQPIPPPAELRSTDKLAAASESPRASARAKQEAPAAGATAAPPASPPPPASAPRAFSDETNTGKPMSPPPEQAAAQAAKRVVPAPASPMFESAPTAQPEKDAASNLAASVTRAEERIATPSEADATAQGKLAKAKPVERTRAIANDGIENDPARWIERIIALRDTGHDEDADRELARLRERYPDMKVPPNALPRTGTR